MGPRLPWSLPQRSPPAPRSTTGLTVFDRPGMSTRSEELREPRVNRPKRRRPMTMTISPTRKRLAHVAAADGVAHAGAGSPRDDPDRGGRGTVRGQRGRRLRSAWARTLPGSGLLVGHTVSPPAPTLTRRDRIRHRIAAVTSLVVVWSLLWGAFTWGNIVAGALVAIVVLKFFPLPPVTFAGRIRILGVANFLLHFLADLLVASVQIAWLALRPGPPPRGAILAVPLRIRSDLNLTLIAVAVTLIPGSIILEADRSSGTLYIHMLGVADRAGVERFRARV